jgi:hypothetical protein
VFRGSWSSCSRSCCHLLSKGFQFYQSNTVLPISRVNPSPPRSSSGITAPPINVVLTWVPSLVDPPVAERTARTIAATSAGVTRPYHMLVPFGR